MNRNPDFQVPSCMYDRFDLIRKLQTMIESHIMPNHPLYGKCIRYEKMVQTGDMDCHDYRTGFLNVSIKPYFDSRNWYVSIYFNTIDDGGVGGWSQAMSQEQAIDLSKKVAYEVFNDMVRLPTLDELNQMLVPYKMYCILEG